MKIEYRPINIDCDFEACVKARKDTHFCGFGTFDGFNHFLDGYRARMTERITSDEWFYLHIWIDEILAGQLEFRCHFPEPECGYILLIYLKPEFRGLNIFPMLQEHIIKVLTHHGCKRIHLSVSRINTRALKNYQAHGWTFLCTNPKHNLTDFYQLTL